MRLHDLRHSFASVAVSGGLSLPIIGALLGHKHAATTARYAHLAAAPLRAANDAVGARITAAMQFNLVQELQNAVRETDKESLQSLSVHTDWHGIELSEEFVASIPTAPRYRCASLMGATRPSHYCSMIWTPTKRL